MCFLFFEQKTAYEMRISDWSSDVCSSDLFGSTLRHVGTRARDRYGGWGERGVSPIHRVLVRQTGCERQDAHGLRAARLAARQRRLSVRRRSEARRVGKECVRTGRLRVLQYYDKKKQEKTKTVKLKK